MTAESTLYLSNRLALAKTQALGKVGELHAATLFEHLGYHVEDTSQLTHQADLRVMNPQTGQVWKVEVKTARSSKTRNNGAGWVFCLKKPGKTDCCFADFVLLQAVRASGQVVTFLIPTPELGMTTKVKISGKSPLEYRGKYARWRVPCVDLKLDDTVLTKQQM